MKDIQPLKEYYQASLREVYDSLMSKSEFIKRSYSQELTEAKMKRIKIEEQHIKKCLEFIETTEKLINALDAGFKVKSKLVEVFYKEQQEYMDKFYNSVDKVGEYNLLKAMIK